MNISAASPLEPCSTWTIQQALEYCKNGKDVKDFNEDDMAETASRFSRLFLGSNNVPSRMTAGFVLCLFLKEVKEVLDGAIDSTKSEHKQQQSASNKHAQDEQNEHKDATDRISLANDLEYAARRNRERASVIEELKKALLQKEAVIGELREQVDKGTKRAIEDAEKRTEYKMTTKQQAKEIEELKQENKRLPEENTAKLTEYEEKLKEQAKEIRNLEATIRNLEATNQQKVGALKEIRQQASSYLAHRHDAQRGQQQILGKLLRDQTSDHAAARTPKRQKTGPGGTTNDEEKGPKPEAAPTAPAPNELLRHQATTQRAEQERDRQRRAQQLAQAFRAQLEEREKLGKMGEPKL